MTNFEFQEVFSFLGKRVDDPDAHMFFEDIHKNYTDSFIVHEPLKEDIKNGNDNWKCYDSKEKVAEHEVDKILLQKFIKQKYGNRFGGDRKGHETSINWKP